MWRFLIGLDCVLGWFKWCFGLSTDFHGCARILLGGFWGVIGVGISRELFKG
jgi:hypothetical protein